MFALPRPRLVQLSGETSSRIITMRAEALGLRHTALLGKARKGVRGGRKVNRYIRDAVRAGAVYVLRLGHPG